jgi:hypothetical protein
MKKFAVNPKIDTCRLNPLPSFAQKTPSLWCMPEKKVEKKEPDKIWFYRRRQNTRMGG